MSTLLPLLMSLFLGFLSLLGVVSGREDTSDLREILVSPQTLILNSDQGGTITVHTDVAARLVDHASLTLNEVSAKGTGVDSRGQIAGLFCESEIEALVNLPSAVLILDGRYPTGESFSGSDTVRVAVK